jgi:CheY-like chemotaxis protein
MQASRRPKLKLLIVDDDPHTRALLTEALEVSGASVRASASAGEARRTLASWHPDLMISDVGMPRESGYELIRRVRRLPAEQGGRTPAIACTGYAREEDRARAMHAGFDAVVSKPVDLGVLVATIVHVAGVRESGSGAATGAPLAGDAGSDECSGAAPRPGCAPDS